MIPANELTRRALELLEMVERGDVPAPAARRRERAGARRLEPKGSQATTCPDCKAETAAAETQARLATVRRAAATRREIAGTYMGHRRLFRPVRIERHHKVDLNEPCTINVVAVQTGGRTSDSRTDLPVVRAFRIAELTDLETEVNTARAAR